MRDFSFELATDIDDPSIRRLLTDNPVPGRITISYEREPDYFRGCGTMGRFWQVVIARQTRTGQIVGLACRATRPMYINGEVEEVGYLGQLRVDHRFESRWLVAFGMRFMRELHQDGRVSGYITTIIEENSVARGILVDRPRPHYPTYREVGTLATLAIMLGRARPVIETPYTIRSAQNRDLKDIINFLSCHGREKNFCPVYELEDFGDGTTTPDFCVNDMFIARHNERIVGIMGLWDQSRFKQTVVRAYSRRLKFVRPVYNPLMRLTGRKPLPTVGAMINHVYASFLCIERNDPRIFGPLLRRAYNEARRRGHAYLSIGLDQRDPLFLVARQYPHVIYPARFYTVCWDPGGEFHAKLDDRIPHVEIAAY